MLVLSMLLTQQDSQDSILHYVANAVESLGSCTTEGIFLDGLWQDIRIPGQKAARLPAVVDAAEGGPVTLADVPWSGGYSLSRRRTGRGRGPPRCRPPTGRPATWSSGPRPRPRRASGSCCRCWPSRRGW